MNSMEYRTKHLSVFNVINISIMMIVCFMVLYPLWFCLIYSFNDGNEAARNGPIYWWPRQFTLENYQCVFQNSAIVQAYAVSIARTAIGTFVHVFFTAMVAYAFSKKYLIGRRLYNTMGIITLFFSGGLIPTYIVIRSLHLLDNFLVYIFPTAFNFFNALIFMHFFRNIPESIEESARVDGANDFYIFIKLIIPLSAPVIATICVYSGVWHWNDYFYGILYITKNVRLIPIQTFLYKVVATTEAYSYIRNSYTRADSGVTTQSVKIATMVITTVPVICIYPFLQKFFTKGLLLGSVKE